MFVTNYYQSNAIALCCNFDSPSKKLLQNCMCLYGHANKARSCYVPKDTR